MSGESIFLEHCSINIAEFDFYDINENLNLILFSTSYKRLSHLRYPFILYIILYIGHSSFITEMEV